tara:strand:+ start:128 stop:604 length:477 start_codon:yes stop_codon:yes gene_type:complete
VNLWKNAETSPELFQKRSPVLGERVQAPGGGAARHLGVYTQFTSKIIGSLCADDELSVGVTRIFRTPSETVEAIVIGTLRALFAAIVCPVKGSVVEEVSTLAVPMVRSLVSTSVTVPDARLAPFNHSVKSNTTTRFAAPIDKQISPTFLVVAMATSLL